MKILLKLLLIPLTYCVFLKCESTPTETDSKTNVIIADVWLSDMADIDNDQYFSNALLNFELESNKSAVDVFVQLGIRETDPNDQSSFSLCFESENIQIEKGADNSWYIPLNAINTEINSGMYDFLLHIYLSNNPEDIAAEASPASDEDLYRIPLESVLDDSPLLTEWISYTDGSFESKFSFYSARPPLGTSTIGMAARFEQPDGAISCKIKQFRIYVKYIRDTEGKLTLNLYNNHGLIPGEQFYSHTNSINVNEGWNYLDLDIDLTPYDTFYVYLGANTTFDVGIDTTNIIESQSLVYRYYSVPDPDLRYRWSTYTEGIFGIDVNVEYRQAMNNKSATRSIRLR